MAGTISSVGIGSGILTSDVLEKLRSADEDNIIKPLDNKIELQAKKKEAFTLLDSLMTNFKSSVSSLSFSTIYQSRTVDTNNATLEVTAEAGSKIENFTLDTIALAKKDISQSGSFSSTTDTVATSSGTMTLSLGDGSSFDIDYTSSTTLSELSDLINEKAGASISSSVVKTGDAAYSLVLSSKNTGANQAVTVSDSNIIPFLGLKDQLYNDFTFSSNFTTNQAASDAEFVYNGININRSSNTITDLAAGVTINLKTEGESANVNISQDTTVIETEMQLLVESYNSLQANVSDMLKADRETGAQGVFNGDNFLKSIVREVNSIITSFDSQNNSLVNYGIELDKSGTMSFNQATFDSEITVNPDGLELFLSGGTDPDTGNTKTGLFETLNTKLKEYTKFGGLLDNFETGLNTRNSSLKEDRLNAIASLDNRYNTLTRQFTAYDAIISKLNSQFSALQLQIQSSISGQ